MDNTGYVVYCIMTLHLVARLPWLVGPLCTSAALTRMRVVYFEHKVTSLYSYPQLLQDASRRYRLELRLLSFALP